MTEITKAEREEFRALHAKTTQGEWHYDDGVTDGEGTADAERGKPAWITTKGNMLIAEPSGSYWQEACVPTLAEMDANGKFIARAHGVVPRLLRALDAAEAERDRMRNEADGYQRLAKESQESQDKSALLVIGPVNDEFRVYGPTPNSEERFAKTFADYWKLINEVARGMSLEAENAALKARLAALVAAVDDARGEVAHSNECLFRLATLDSAKCGCGVGRLDTALAAAKEPQPARHTHQDLRNAGAVNHDEGRVCGLCGGDVPSGFRHEHGDGVCRPAAKEPQP